MDANSLSKLSSEKIAVLNDQQKAVFCILSPADQEFFATAYSPRDLPVALERKGEILQRNQDARQRLEKLQAHFASRPSPVGSATVMDPNDILTAVAGAVGIGAAAHAVATDHTARWQGVDPKALIPPLRAEFEDKELTDISFDGTPDAMEGTVYLGSTGKPVPALTINLTHIEDGVEVKVSNLTSQGALEMFKNSGKRLFSLAEKGFMLWSRKNRALLNPLDWMNSADSLFTDAADVAQMASDLKLEERAWRVIKNTAESTEKSYLDHARLEREARSTLERAWDDYRTCSTCAVPFAAEDQTCRVCGAARSPVPQTPDPRQGISGIMNSAAPEAPHYS